MTTSQREIDAVFRGVAPEYKVKIIEGLGFIRQQAEDGPTCWVAPYDVQVYMKDTDADRARRQR